MSESIQAGTLYLVATPIGNLEDMTYRAVKILSSVDMIAAEDTRTTKILLDHYNIVKPMVSYYSYNEQARAPQLIEKLLAGQSVAVVSDAGTPGISDPAFHIVQQALENNIHIIPVPGASAVLSALIVSGLPTDRFVFEGFLPLKKGRKTKFELLKMESRTVVLYESPHRIVRTLEDILEHLGNRRVAVARELTKKFEEVLRGTTESVLAEIKSKQPRGEYVIVLNGSQEKTMQSTMNDNP
ncbi:MAG TPA: 16S rRNA (cytidine(1402)-2'-O)-methyltransferase [Bacteroidota bacterium]|nr:16S rRNA (cytidine(1402)-2'-O)-methyltransferase [Bacteroidota bacterium]